MPLLTTLASDALSGYGFSRGSATPTGFNLISTTLLSSTTSSVTFSAIPANYTHLQLRIVARGSVASSLNSMTIRLNSDSGSNYGYQNIKGNGASATANYSSSYQTSAYIGDMPGSSSLANSFGASIIDILDYSNTNKIKTLKAFGGNAGYLDVTMFNGLWNSTSAISTILLSDTIGSASFVAGTRVSLYGIGS